MDKRQLLWGFGIVTLLFAVLIIVVIAATGQHNQVAKTGSQTESVSLNGTLACLPHKGSPDQPQTLECAIGLKTDDGRYYKLEGLTDKQSGTSFNTRIFISGIMTPPVANELYDIQGSVAVSSFTASSK